jgi:hypothetical protein
VGVQIKYFLDVAARTREFGCRVPVMIALLPGNFSTAANPGEFCYHAATPYVRSAWRSVGLEDEGPLQPDHLVQAQAMSDWISWSSGRAITVALASSIKVMHSGLSH